MTTKLVEVLGIEAAAVPLDTTGAAVNGDWFNMKYYGKVAFVILQGAWVGGTPAVTVNQATSNAGAGSKAVPVTKRWSKVGITGGVFTEAAVTANTFNLTATANTITVVEVNAEDLDVNGGFTYVQLAVASPGANADLIAVLALLGDPRYSGAPGTHLPDAKV